MKNIFISCFILFFFNTLSAETQIPKEISIIAEQIELDLENNGHRDIESHLSKVSLQELTHYTHEEQNLNYDEPLSDETVTDLFVCLETQGCDLYLIKTNSDYHSGYGIEAAFVIMEPETNIFEIITHGVDSE